MTNKDYLDGKVEALIPYRGLPESTIEIKGNQYLITQEQQDKLVEYDQKINDLETCSLKDESVKITKDFGIGCFYGNLPGIGILTMSSSCADFLQLEDSRVQPLFLGILLTSVVAGLISGGSYTLKNYFFRRKTRKKEFVKIKNKRQNLLEELIK